MNEEKMDEPYDDISMKLRGFGDSVLATKHVATALAEMLIIEEAGEKGLEFQKPLTVSELADRWVIEGRDEYKKMDPPFDMYLEGKITIEILKRNCRVIKFIQSSAF